MPKYCMSCGSQNEDQAAFCAACGAPLPEVVQGAPAGSPGEGAAAQQAFATFTAEMGPGAHEHIFTDVSLKDDKGAVVYIAKRPSMLHENFEIVNPQGETKGRVSRKMHLTHQSFEICDPYDNVLNVFNVGTRRRNVPPHCWLEDASKNTQGTIEWMAGFFSFGLVKPDGSRVFNARLTTQGGISQKLKELGSRRYAIDLLDPAFSTMILAGTIAAIDVS
jgi:hypothetical protein